MFKIIKKERLNPTVTKMVIDAPFIAKKAEPGQFIILRALEDSERIPLTIADYDREGGTITIIYQIVGGSTMELDTLEEGRSLHDFVGPLGVATHTEGLKKVAVVGGGVGCAIALPVTKKLHEQGFVPENVFLERLPEIAKNAIADACTGSNPRKPSQEEMEKLLKCCYYDTEVDF